MAAAGSHNDTGKDKQIPTDTRSDLFADTSGKAVPDQTAQTAV